jgi:hypothetical protein
LISRDGNRLVGTFDPYLKVELHCSHVLVVPFLVS